MSDVDTEKPRPEESEEAPVQARCAYCGESVNAAHAGEHDCEDANIVEGLHAMDCAGWL